MLNNTINVSFSNVFTENLNALTFSLLGMSVVFVGLICISIYITVLPKILKMLERKAKTATPVVGPPSESTVVDKTEDDTYLAIAMALHMERHFLENSQKITWDMYDDKESLWKIGGRFANLGLRENAFRRR
ncbi:MAG: OadG family protein [Bacteriovoracaceae bacterium]|nr:OadG family protein [Bacteriovoracaceae bacterium]